MTLLLAVASIVLVAVAIALVARLPAGLAAVARVARTPTTPLARAAAGPIEVAGVVRAEGATLRSIEGAPAVALCTRVRPQAGTGRGARPLPEIVVDRHVAARLEDGGASAAIDLAGAALVGPTRSLGVVVERARLDEAVGPELARRVPREATHGSVFEVAIPDGARVLVSGEAVPAGPRPGDDYRRAEVAWMLRGRPDRLLVVSLGTQAAFFARALAPVVVVIGAAVALVALAAANLALLAG